MVQVSYKAFAYSVKLKCEIGILNRLVDFVKTTRPESFHLTSQVEREWQSTLQMTFGLSREGSCEKAMSAPASLPTAPLPRNAVDCAGASTGISQPRPLAQLPDSERVFVQQRKTLGWPLSGAGEK